MEKLWISSGTTISKKGLPGGKLECKKGADPLELEEKFAKVIEKNIPFLKVSGKLLDQAGYDNVMTVEEPEDTGKSEKRIALEKEATELEIEFNDRTSQKDLIAMIEAVKEELES